MCLEMDEILSSSEKIPIVYQEVFCKGWDTISEQRNASNKLIACIKVYGDKCKFKIICINKTRATLYDEFYI